MDESINLTRRELYERVWSEPVRTLAPKFGLSDVALNRMRLVLSIAAILLGFATTSHLAAAHIKLLGAIHDRIDFSDHYPGGPPITEQHFALTFQSSNLLPNPDPSAWPYTSCIGCDLSIPLGWTGTVDFNSGTGYSEFVNRLTNGVNDGSLWQLHVLTRSDGLATAFGKVANEYDWFAPRDRVDDWVIDAVRLRVIRNRVLLDNDIAFAEGSYHVIWEFWGTRE